MPHWSLQCVCKQWICPNFINNNDKALLTTARQGFHTVLLHHPAHAPPAPSRAPCPNAVAACFCLLLLLLLLILLLCTEHAAVPHRQLAVEAHQDPHLRPAPAHHTPPWGNSSSSSGGCPRYTNSSSSRRGFEWQQGTPATMQQQQQRLSQLQTGSHP
jgi:hypothetical protein